MSDLDNLTHRQLWRNIMHYRTSEFDRMPVIHWTGWDETFERWWTEGFPQGVGRWNEPAQCEYFRAVPMWSGVGLHCGLHPGFERRVVEETDEYTVFWDHEGVLLRDLKHAGSVPHYMDYTLKTAADWPQYKRRLQPDSARIPADLDEKIRRAEASGNPIAIMTGSMMGWLRNWMGVENMCYLTYDSPETFADYVETMSDLVCWQIDQVIPRMTIRPDLAHGWEDIAGSTGPFVSPDFFDKHVAPGYRKIRDKLESYGVDIYSIDSDGKVEPLIGNWLAAGVNMQFPLEPGTWGCTPEAMRKKFGKDLLIQGGFDKLALERGRDAIDAEIKKHILLMKEGGYVMMPDHVITPGVPLNDYKYYLDRIRELRF